MHTTRTLSVLAAVGTLALAGCTSSSEENSTPATTTETQAVPASDSGTALAEVTENRTITPTSAGSGEEDPAPPENRDDLPRAPVGEEVTIAGEPATVCIHGDGWGTNIWAGNAATSCEFVSETHQALIEGLDPTRDNIREHLKPRVTVHSPVTGEDYELECAPRGEVLLSCTGGEGATVYFY